jgi:hypothetical protein
VDHKGHRRNNQKGKRCEKGEPVGRLHLLYLKNLDKGCKDESPSHKPRDIRVYDDEQIPVQLDLIGINEADDLFEGCPQIG